MVTNHSLITITSSSVYLVNNIDIKNMQQKSAGKHNLRVLIFGNNMILPHTLLSLVLAQFQYN